MPKSALKCFNLFLALHNALFKENLNIQTENILLLKINGCEAVGLNWPLCEWAFCALYSPFIDFILILIALVYYTLLYNRSLQRHGFPKIIVLFAILLRDPLFSNHAINFCVQQN